MKKSNLKQIFKNILFVFLFVSLILPSGAIASAGTPDTTFTTNMGTGFDNVVRASVVLSDGKIIVGGSFNYLNDIIDANYVAGLNSDGTPYTAFNTNLGTGFSDAVYAMAVQSDDKIIVGGSFTSVNGTPSNRIARLNSDGTLDTTFTTNIGTGFGTTRVTTIAIQSNGKIIVGGTFSTINGVTSNKIARLNSDGTPDTTFTTNIGTGFGSSVYRVGIQSDGKIIVGGIFSSLNGVTSNYIARLGSDGTPDTTFTTNIGTGFDNDVQTLAVLSNDKIVVGGFMEDFNGTSIHFFAGLNSDGTPDTTFNTNLGTGFGNAVETVTIQSNGKIVVGGSFTSINGVTSNRIARLSSTGIPDTTFTTNIGTGFNGTTRTITVQSDGKIIVGGSFSSINSVTTGSLARLDGDPITPTLTTSSASDITTTTATLNGNITATGGESNTARGFNIGLDTDYTMTSISESGSYSTGAYTGSATGLTCNTLYHYRAYSTNSAGTGYGSDTTFTTSACPAVASSGGAVPLYILQAMSDATRKEESIKNQNIPNNSQENLNQDIVNNTKFIFNKNLRFGMRDNDVLELQKYLNNNGFTVSKSGIGSKGKETNYFGPATRSALIKFQKANNIKPALGYFGIYTRNFVNK